MNVSGGRKRKTATDVPGLKPINIDSNMEFYLGVRNPQTKKYEGHKLFFDKASSELAPTLPDASHKSNQLWRFQRAFEYPKGVHAIVAVEAQARFACEMLENEDGEPVASIDFTDIYDQDA